MLTGAVGAGVGSLAGGILPNQFGYQLVGRVVSGAIAGGIVSEIYGGNFWQGFAQGAATAAAEFLFNWMMHEPKTFPWLKERPLYPGQVASRALLPGAIIVEGSVLVGVGGYFAPEFAALTVKYGTIYIFGNPNTYQFILDFMQGAAPTLPPASWGGLAGYGTKWTYDQLNK